MQIARALMTDPELLILDEPAAGLDLGGREDLVATLSVLALDEYSPATILVSHHVEEIPPGFTHALMLREGRVVAAGPLPEVMNAEQLSATFGMRLVAARGGRPLLRPPDGASARLSVASRWIGSRHGLAAATTCGRAGSLSRSRSGLSSWSASTSS